LAILGWPHLSGASSAALPQDRWRSMAAAAWTVSVCLACVSVAASVRAWSGLAWGYWLGWCLGARLPRWREHAGHRGRRPGILGGDVAL
jgi:fatty acid desaturase